MKLTRYLYKGPQSGAQLRVGAKAELLEVQLNPGKPVDLPADHEYTQVQRHPGWTAFVRDAQPDPARMFAMTTQGAQPVHSTCFLPGDWLIFGAETRGLPPELRDSFPPAQRLRLPMVAGQRSLNLSNAVAVTVFEAWRQNSFAMPDGEIEVEPEGTIISGFAQLI